MCAVIYQYWKSSPGEQWLRNPSHPRMRRAAHILFHMVGCRASLGGISDF
jgi:hypothetical protein